MIKYIPVYPETSEITLDMRPALHPLFIAAEARASECSFANIFLFRRIHGYRVTRLPDGPAVITGEDAGAGAPFFMLPFGLPKRDVTQRLFESFSFIKALSEARASELAGAGFRIEEDRDNFDYVYLREDLSRLEGRRFHGKKNLVNLFTSTYSYEVRPLMKEYMADARSVLDEWKSERPDEGDTTAAAEALTFCETLQLCGFIYYVNGLPAAYVLGEELGQDTFVVHFEKSVDAYKGLYQFVNRHFASVLPERYRFINREQDLGDEGLRKAKMSYRPVKFLKKFRAYKG